MSILEVRNLSVQYHTGQESRQALDGISFSVGEGETVGIVGESGSGKSTAMLAVMGLLGDSAEVSSDGITVCERPVQPGRDIAMILQDSLNCLNPAVKIGRQITETVRIHRKCTRREAKERAEELLDMAGIRSPKLRMGQYPFELSGGMRQRVAIAIALACEPRVIIADEPTTALDAAVQVQILHLLKRIVEDTGASLPEAARTYRFIRVRKASMFPSWMVKPAASSCPPNPSSRSEQASSAANRLKPP